MTLDSHLHELGPVLAGTVVATLTLVPLTMLSRRIPTSLHLSRNSPVAVSVL